MIAIKICSDNAGIDDTLLSMTVASPRDAETIVSLVQHGGIAAGMIKPAVDITYNGKSQIVSSRNDWKIDHASLA